MIYFDNSATTLMKPQEVGEAVAYAVSHFGNAGRSFYDSAMLAGRAVYDARAEIARLTGLSDPLRVAFTSSATESLNLVIGGLVQKEDSVITSVTEHNSVLRPLYQTGCECIFLDCDDMGNILADELPGKIRPNTKFLICTHGSNVTGNITDTACLYEMCRDHGIVMILDAAQTLGSIEARADMADILCFTGHKALFGPQGTGGIIVNGDIQFQIVKTGGAGTDSFAPRQSAQMPDVFEAGTLNSHGLHGLQKGAAFIYKTGVDVVHARETVLVNRFYKGVSQYPQVRLYGDFQAENRLPIVSLNISGLTSGELAALLWERYGIATRPGSHCAPLLHKRLGTVETGIVRFSFSYFNTEREIDEGVEAIGEIIENLQ